MVIEVAGLKPWCYHSSICHSSLSAHCKWSWSSSLALQEEQWATVWLPQWLCGLPQSADWIGCRRLQPCTGNYICLLNMSHIINTCSWLTRNKSQLRKQKNSGSYGFINPGFSEGETSQKSKCVHASELMKNRSAKKYKYLLICWFQSIVIYISVLVWTISWTFLWVWYLQTTMHGQ